jgi:hypothetical protein
MMVIAAGVEERAAAHIAQWMRNEPDLRPARAAEVFSITAVDSAAASTAARRIEPVH